MLAPVGGAFTGLWQALGIAGFHRLGSGTQAFAAAHRHLAMDAFVTLPVFAALLGVPDEL
jgi:multiple sugar transport system permease protein